MTKCRETGLFSADTFGQHVINGFTIDMAINPDLVAGWSAKQLVNRRIQCLALDIPEGNIDCRNTGIDGQTLKIAESMHDVPVMLDSARILADKILGKAGDCGA